jgi:hypothetical protein
VLNGVQGKIGIILNITLHRGVDFNIKTDQTADRGLQGGDIVRRELIHKTGVLAGFSLHNVCYETFHFLTIEPGNPAFMRILIIFSWCAASMAL